MLNLRPEAPLDPISVAIVNAVVSAAHAAGTTAVLVGATARDILLGHIYDIPLRRATADLDFAVAIPGWDAFREVLLQLQQDGRFRRDADVAHRLYFRHPSSPNDTPVDIVPFGEGVGALLFRWPDDPHVEMNVTGYAEASHTALTVDIDGKAVSVLSAGGLSLLKLFAWADRRGQTKKDAGDLLTLARHYWEVGNRDRMYEDPALLDDVGHDYLRGGARLLARDIRQMCADHTLASLRALLIPENIEALAYDAYREGAGGELTIDRVVELLNDFTGEISP